MTPATSSPSRSNHRDAENAGMKLEVPSRDRRSMPAVGAGGGAALLHESCNRAARYQLCLEHFLGLEVRLGLKIAGTRPRPELLDSAEIARHAARGLERGGGQHVDQGGADGHLGGAAQPLARST
jgi:hypothetical protein